MATDRITAYIAEQIAKAPKLTEEQRTRLGELLAPARDYLRQAVRNDS